MPDDRFLAGGEGAPGTAREERLALVASSLAARGARDRSGWYALFAEGAYLEAPVGAPPFRKGRRTAGLLGRSDELLAFHDAFLEGSELRLEVHQDIVLARSVARDMTLHARISRGLPLRIEAYMLYELAVESGRPRIGGLAAHWDTARSANTALAAGLRGSVPVALTLARMLRHLGPLATRAYVRGTRSGVRSLGRGAVAAFAAALSTGDSNALETLATRRATIALGDGADRPARDLVAAELGLRVWDMVASGYTVACRCQVSTRQGGGARRGLGFFEFDRPTRAISRVRLLYEP